MSARIRVSRREGKRVRSQHDALRLISATYLYLYLSTVVYSPGLARGSSGIVGSTQSADKFLLIKDGMNSFVHGQVIDRTKQIHSPAKTHLRIRYIAKLP